MDGDEGFLSRWSRRKAQVRQGQAVVDPAPPVEPVPVGVPAPTSAPAPVQATVADAYPDTSPAEPPPTLDDVARLPADAPDFSRFVAPQVDPQVRNAAMKKLFTDPHFNVMDGLDVYIDDYSQPDPLPAGMLRQLVQSRMLGLFADEPEVAPAVPPAATVPSPIDNATDEPVRPQALADEPPPGVAAPAAHEGADAPDGVPTAAR